MGKLKELEDYSIAWLQGCNRFLPEGDEAANFAGDSAKDPPPVAGATSLPKYEVKGPDPSSPKSQGLPDRTQRNVRAVGAVLRQSIAMLAVNGTDAGCKLNLKIAPSVCARGLKVTFRIMNAATKKIQLHEGNCGCGAGSLIVANVRSTVESMKDTLLSTQKKCVRVHMEWSQKQLQQAFSSALAFSKLAADMTELQQYAKTHIWDPGTELTNTCRVCQKGKQECQKHLAAMKKSVEEHDDKNAAKEPTHTAGKLAGVTTLTAAAREMKKAEEMQLAPQVIAAEKRKASSIAKSITRELHKREKKDSAIRIAKIEKLKGQIEEEEPKKAKKKAEAKTLDCKKERRTP